jgi:hypothetical protein
VSDWKERLRQLKLGLRDSLRKSEKASAVAAREEQRHRPRQWRDLCVGLDFGTSSTKAVVRLLPTGPAYAVPLGGPTGSGVSYLAPTCLWVAPSGELSLRRSDGARRVEELKVRLMTEPWENAPPSPGLSAATRPVDLAAAYLGLALRDVLAWFGRDLRPALGPVEARWSMNVGIPVRDYDEDRVKNAFLMAARAGWRLARLPGPVSIGRTVEAVRAAQNDALSPGGVDENIIEVVPEVAAGVASYARSTQRRPGAHLFVDVGATTLDSSMFLLAEPESGLKYVFLSADVDPKLGVLQLHHYRAEELRRLVLARVDAADPLAPVPGKARDCLPKEAELSRIDEEFERECEIKLGRVVYRAKQKAPNDISEPDDRPGEAINVMVGGGGMFHSLYQEAIRKAGENAAPGGKLGLRVRRFDVVKIPRDSNLRPRDLPEEVWCRLAIAYGLSYRYEDIGEYVPPSAVPEPPRPHARDDAAASGYIGKEQV